MGPFSKLIKQHHTACVCVASLSVDKTASRKFQRVLHIQRAYRMARVSLQSRRVCESSITSAPSSSYIELYGTNLMFSRWN